MFKADHYVPVLKGKQGERQALKALPDTTKDQFTPLVEVDDIAEDPESGQLKATVDDHSAKGLKQLAEGWGTQRVLFLDATSMDEYESAKTPSKGGVEVTFDEAAALGLQFIPAIGLRRPSSEIAAAMKHKQRGICLRLEDDDLGSASLQSDLDDFLSDNDLEHRTVDMVIDLGVVTGYSVPRILSLAVNYLRGFPNLPDWRTLSLTASAFPATMGDVNQGTTTVTRAEWLAWNQLYQQRAKLVRLPTFGDYGIQHPIMTEGFDPRFMAPSASIRYTLDNEWLILKGQSTRRTSGKIQFPQLAKQLVARTEFMGAGHCPGCEEINGCATGGGRYGSAAPWRRIGAAHHLSLTVSQIASLTFP